MREGALRLAFPALVALDLAHRLVTLSAGIFPLQRDALGYWRIARGLVEGQGFLGGDPFGHRTPLYPLYLALCQLLGGRWALELAVVGQHLMGVGTALLVRSLCVRWGRSRSLGLVGYFLVAAGFGRVQFDHQIYTESMFTLLLMVHLWLLSRFLERRDGLSVFLAGLALGACCLTRAAALFLFLPELLVLMAFVPRHGLIAPRRMARLCAVLSLGLAIPTGVWASRNQVQFGDFGLRRLGGVAAWEHTFRARGAALSLPAGAWEALAECADWRSGWQVSACLRERGWSYQQIEIWMSAAAQRAQSEQHAAYRQAVLRNALRFWVEVEEAIPFYSRNPREGDQSFEGQRVWNEPGIWRPAEPLLRALYRYPWWLQATFALLAALGIGAFILRGGASAVLGWLLLSWMAYFCLVTTSGMYPLFRYRMVLDPAMTLAVVAGLGPGLRSVAISRLPWGEASEGSNRPDRT